MIANTLISAESKSSASFPAPGHSLKESGAERAARPRGSTVPRVREVISKGVGRVAYGFAFGLSFPVHIMSRAVSRNNAVGFADRDANSFTGRDRSMKVSANSKPESFLTRKLNWGFRRYVRRFISRNFNAVRVANTESLQAEIRGPLICFVNHPGWWDPMTAVLVTDEFFSKRRFHAPMDAVALKKYPILEKLGFFPLDRDTNAGLKDFLRHAQKLLEDDSTIFWLTPTGRFTDVRDRAPFMGGLGHISKANPVVSVLPVAVEYTFWNERYPELLIEFGPVLSTTSLPLDKAERSLMLEESLTRVQVSLAQKAINRSPEGFTTIALGQSGIGGMYDWLRRVTAFLTGRTFQSRHDSTAVRPPQTTRSEHS